MKPAFVTISYVVYSPDYVPGKGKYAKVDSLRSARRQCRKQGFGTGSEIERHFHTGNRRGQKMFSECGMKRRKWRGPWVYQGEKHG